MSLCILYDFEYYSLNNMELTLKRNEDFSLHSKFLIPFGNNPKTEKIIFYYDKQNNDFNYKLILSSGYAKSKKPDLVKVVNLFFKEYENFFSMFKKVFSTLEEFKSSVFLIKDMNPINFRKEKIAFRFDYFDLFFSVDLESEKVHLMSIKFLDSFYNNINLNYFKVPLLNGFVYSEAEYEKFCKNKFISLKLLSGDYGKKIN